jgi:hypothetical protein
MFLSGLGVRLPLSVSGALLKSLLKILSLGIYYDAGFVAFSCKVFL